MNILAPLFEGRIGRAHFAWTCLAFIGIAIVMNIVTYAFSLFGDVVSALVSFVMFAVSLALAVVGLGVSVRRYHDFNWSGWFVLLGFVPILNFIMLLVLLFKKGDLASNRFGETVPKTVPLADAVLNRPAGSTAAAVAATPVVTPAEPVAQETAQAATPAEPAAAEETTATEAPAEPQQPAAGSGPQA